MLVANALVGLGGRDEYAAGGRCLRRGPPSSDDLEDVVDEVGDEGSCLLKADGRGNDDDGGRNGDSSKFE